MVKIKCGQRPGNETQINTVYPGFVNKALKSVVHPGFVSKLKNGKCGRPQNEAKGIHLYYRCLCYKNVDRSETSWHSWLKKTFLKVLTCSQPLPTSEPSNKMPDVGRGTEWGRTWVSTSVDSLSILNLFIDLLYYKKSKLRAWEAAIHVLLMTGYCEGSLSYKGLLTSTSDSLSTLMSSTVYTS